MQTELGQMNRVSEETTWFVRECTKIVERGAHPLGGFEGAESVAHRWNMPNSACRSKRTLACAGMLEGARSGGGGRGQGGAQIFGSCPRPRFA